jgi:glutaredoxin
MKRNFFIFIFCLFLLFNLNSVLAQAPSTAKSPIDLYFFRGEGCSHCAAAEAFFGDVIKQYPQLQIKSFEVFNNEANRQLYFAFAKAYNLSLDQLSVPVIFIGDKQWVGFNDSIQSQIKDEIIHCSSQVCPSPDTKVLEQEQQTDQTNTNKQAALGWVIIILIVVIIVIVLIKLFKKKK